MKTMIRFYENFCTKCLGSTYLKRGELYLLRLRPVSTSFRKNRPPLSADERDTLEFLYAEAQQKRLNRKAEELRAAAVKAYAADSSSPADRAKLGEEYELWRAKATVQKEAKPVRTREPTIEPVDEVVKIDVDEEEV